MHRSLSCHLYRGSVFLTHSNLLVCIPLLKRTWRQQLRDGPWLMSDQTPGDQVTAYYATQAKSLSLSRPHFFVFKMKLCLCTQTTFVILSGSKNVLSFFKTMLSFYFFLYKFSILFSSYFESLLLHFDVKIGKVYDNLDCLGLFDFPRRK